MEPIVFSGWGIGLSIATIVTASAAVVALIFAAKQLGAATKQGELIRKQTDAVIEHKKVDRAYDYLRAYGDPNFRPIAAEAINFLKREDMTLANKWKILEDKDDPKHVDLKSKVVYTLNFFDELGVMYNRNLTDKEIIKAFFKDLSLKYTEYAARYIAYRREEIPGVYVEWGKMNNDFKKT